MHAGPPDATSGWTCGGRWPSTTSIARWPPGPPTWPASTTAVTASSAGSRPSARCVFEHYLTLFARALGIEFEDTYKKYVLWGDPERILEDASPCMAANGVDPSVARGLVIKTFAATP